LQLTKDSEFKAIFYHLYPCIPVPPQNTRFRATGGLQFSAIAPCIAITPKSLQ